MNKLEHKITKGRAVWITTINTSFIENRIVISYTHDPDSMNIIHQLIFTDVLSFNLTSNPEDFDLDCMETIIGITKEEDIYHFHTSGYEFSIRTTNEPKITK